MEHKNLKDVSGNLFLFASKEYAKALKHVQAGGRAKISTWPEGTYLYNEQGHVALKAGIQTFQWMPDMLTNMQIADDPDAMAINVTAIVSEKWICIENKH